MGLDFQYTAGQTALREEGKEGLKISSITTQSELNELEQMNIEKAVQWSLQIRLDSDKILTEKFIKELHKRMYGDVWKWAGTFRKSEKNVGVQWTQIATAFRVLLDDTQYWIENKTYPNTEIAIRFKHRLVSIHCFPNGNGRHSRLVADIIMESIFGQEIFTWNSSSLIEGDVIRKAYIVTLKQADNGDIDPLIKFAKS